MSREGMSGDGVRYNFKEENAFDATTWALWNCFSVVAVLYSFLVV